MKSGYLKDLLRSTKTVFSTDELAFLWHETNRDRVQDRARYYIKQKQLYSIRKGFYAKDPKYNRYEFANKLYNPSYISLETVLAKEGLVSQYYETVHLVSYLSKEIEIDNQNYSFKKIKNITLTNTQGLYQKDNFWIASRERAFLDALYLYQDYHFDNLLGLNWDLCFELVSIYRNQKMRKRLEEYKLNYA